MVQQDDVLVKAMNSLAQTEVSGSSNQGPGDAMVVEAGHYWLLVSASSSSSHPV
jgi:hypothetical protein